MLQFRAVVFDLDGTLVDSLADIASAVNAVLGAHGRPVHPVEAYRAMVGWGLKKLLVTATSSQPLEGPEFDEAYRELLAGYRARPVAETRVYEGVAEMLASLGTGVRLGVLSNKDQEISQAIVGRLFPGVPFRAVWGGNAGRPPKPDPAALVEMLGQWGLDPGACVYVGDSEVDMETARRAGVTPVGVAWGFRDPGTLGAAGASEVFDRAADLGAWLGSRMGR